MGNRLRAVTAILMSAGLVLAALVGAGPTGADEGPLGADDFVPLARGGFSEVVDGDAGLVPTGVGNEHQVFIWSMATFDGALYVGTGTIPSAEGLASGSPELIERWRAEIWRYDFGGSDGTTGTWTRVHRSGLLPLYGMFPSVPRDFGYRGMTVCDGRLWVATFGTTPRILVSADGVTFGPANTSGLPTGQLGYRGLLCLDGHVVTSPIGTPDNPDIAPGPPEIYANADPLTRPWVRINEPGFGDPANVAVFSMTTWDRDGDGERETLVASTINRATGAQVWINEDPCGVSTCAGATHRWELVVSHGAGRPFEPPWNRQGSTEWGPHNAGAGWMTEFEGDLWIGFSEAASGGNGVGLGELVRVRPDLSWELVTGLPRAPWPGYNAPADFSDLSALGGTASSYAAIDLAGGITATTFFGEGPAVTIPYPLAGNPCDPTVDPGAAACSPVGDRGLGLGTVVDPVGAPAGFADGDHDARILELYAELNALPGVDLDVPSPVSADWAAIHPLVRLYLGVELIEGAATAGYIWQLVEHDGYLYVSTLDRATPRDGFDVFATAGGPSPVFSDVVTNGFGNPINGGGRTLASTEFGLAVGTLNLGAFRGLAGDAGAEVWFGS